MAKSQVVCKMCPNDFMAENAEINRGRGIYCSRKCAVLAKKYWKPSLEHRASITQKLKGRIFKPRGHCADCGTQFTHWYKATTCSECYHRRRAEAAHGRDPIKVRLYSARRRALKRGSEGDVSKDSWLALKESYGHKCPCCLKEEPEVSLTLDHIVPISRGGVHDISNIQPLCFLCNLKKGVKTIYYPNLVNV